MSLNALYSIRQEPNRQDRVQLHEALATPLTRRVDLHHNMETAPKDHGVFPDNRSPKNTMMSQTTLVSSEGVGGLIAMPGAWFESGSS